MILDTSFIIDFMANDPKAVDKLRELVKRREPQLITTLSIFELFSGLVRSKRPMEEKYKVMKILEEQTVLSFDSDAAERSGEIDGILKKAGKDIGPIDSMIAGIALSKNQKVLTRNVKDFQRIKGLNIESY